MSAPFFKLGRSRNTGKFPDFEEIGEFLFSWGLASGVPLSGTLRRRDPGLVIFRAHVMEEADQRNADIFSAVYLKKA